MKKPTKIIVALVVLLIGATALRILYLQLYNPSYHKRVLLQSRHELSARECGVINRKIAQMVDQFILDHPFVPYGTFCILVPNEFGEQELVYGTDFPHWPFSVELLGKIFNLIDEEYQRTRGSGGSGVTSLDSGNEPVEP